MPAMIDAEHINVDDLSGIWSPVQWELNEDERIQELEDQATASMLWIVDIPEAILRLLLGEHEIERSLEPPENFDPEKQGEWDESLLTFQFKQPIKLIKVKRDTDLLYIEYKLGDLGYWAVEIQPDKVNIWRL